MTPRPQHRSINVSLILIIGLIVISAVIAAYAYRLNHRPPQPLAPYFSYSMADINALKSHKTTSQITTDNIYAWDNTAFRLVKSNQLNDVEASRVYAYLHVAQRDHVALAIAAHQQYDGDVGVVSRDVLCVFFTRNCDDLPTAQDDYSEAISRLIVARVHDRIAADAAQTKPYTLKTDPRDWGGTVNSTGIDAGSRKPWHLSSGDQFRVAPPPSEAAYRDLLADVKHQLDNITQEQREATVYWAGGPGTKTPPGIWLDIADRYMREHTVALGTLVSVHCDLSTAMADAVIAVFDSKYTYQMKRPFARDPSIKTVMPTPDHPSYPAGHATISGAAATVLTHYFPSATDHWQQLGQQASSSRTWGGIHFTVDNTAGYDLGQKVANAALKGSAP